MVQEALSHPGWRQAMVDEMMESNHLWTLVPLPPGSLPLAPMGFHYQSWPQRDSASFESSSCGKRIHSDLWS